MFRLNPPPYGYPDDGEERPPFVLIEPKAYFADRDNATTAKCTMGGFKGEFKVTFCPVRPPRVSYMCFYATDYKHTDFIVEPQIVATETDGGLVLLRVVFAHHLTRVKFPQYGEYLVYDASGPSLDYLPHPTATDIVFNDDSVAFLRKCTQGSSHDYILAAHSGEIWYGESSELKLYLYRSDSKIWITKRLVMKAIPVPVPVPYHSTCKTITIGGDKGIVAWVDLWNNIVMCNVFSERPKLHCLELPAQILLPGAMPGGDPRSTRDIAFLGGLFKFVEMRFHSHDQPRSSYWEAKVWSTKPGNLKAKDWITEHEFRSSDVTELPMVKVDPGKPQPTLSTLHTGLPNLSLLDDGIVYFLSKVHHCNNDHMAWVLAVNMASKTVETVGEFLPMRTLGLARGYNATRVSKYLKGTKQNQKRPGTPILKCPAKKPSSLAYDGASVVN